ncbi:TonB-dependent receptor family protein [Inhella crocodyli]|uniref:TonB-dependent receptor n=1 Tax=Inhella crocodyli TaxID=2499851 RepID=A0A3S2XR92_9BURK|nr:TonB-dependent receptor [Inhella crocodyli]RVT85044.1 TonB-dependent receptor [Inhella crocodyli]
MIEVLLLTTAGALPPVVVTGGLRNAPLLDVPSAVGVLDAEALARSGPGAQLSEALLRLPGVWAADRGNAAQDLQLSVRGFGARASFGVRGLRLFVDGLPATAPDGSGAVGHFPLDAAAQLELLRGPFSALHGVHSGGVLSLRTRAPQPGPTRWQAEAWAQSDDQQQLRLQAEGGADASPWRLGLAHWRSAGQRPQAKAERSLLDARWDWTPGWSARLNLHSQPAQDPLGLTRAQWQADPESTAAAALAFHSRKTLQQQQLGVAGGWNDWQLRAWASARQVRQWQAIPVATQAPAAHPGGVIDLDRRQVGADLRHEGPGWTVGVQLDAQDEQRRGFENFVGPALGVTGALRRDERNTAFNGEVYAQSEHRLTDGLALHAGLRLGQLRVASRDRFLANGDDGGRQRTPTALPALGLVGQLGAGTRGFASLGQARETPTLAELAYRPDGSAGLNTGLKAQRSRQGEAGLKHRDGVWAWEAVAFAADTADEIVSARNSGGRAAFANAGRTRRQGLELQAQGPLVQGWRFALAATALSARVRQPYAVCGAPPCASAALTVAAGARLPGVPARALRLDLESPAAAPWQAGLTLSGRSRLWVDERNSDAAPGTTLLAAWARWRVDPDTTLTLRADNLADRRHVASVIVNEANGRFFEPGPGRRLSLQLQHRSPR